MLRYLLLVIMFSFFSFANLPLQATYNTYNAPRRMTTAKGATTTYYYDQFGNKTQSINEYNQMSCPTVPMDNPSKK